MPDDDRIQQATQFLVAEHEAGRSFAPIPAPYTPRTLEEAYAIQDAFSMHMMAAQGARAGYKIALTTKKIQQLLGVDAPAAGTILTRNLHYSPCDIRGADYMHLGVECEIAVQMAKTLPASGAPWSRDRVADAIDSVMPAFELVDDRNVKWAELAPHLLSGIADNIWNAGIILGAPVTDWRSLDLAEARGTMSINGKVVGEGQGKEVMGHPLEALTWLANMLAKRGASLGEGMVVVTGSFISLEFVRPEDTVEAVVEGLGKVQMRVV